MNDDTSSQATLDTLMAGAAVQGAAVEALLFLCREIADRNGIAEIDGLSIDDWFQRQKLLQLERTLIRLEDRDAGHAAVLQNIIDESKKRQRNRDGEGQS